MISLALVSSSCGLWFLFASWLCTLCFCTQNINNILCIANERSVLLQFKNNLVDQANRLSSWTGQDCCRWSGVVCDNFTGHVHEIRLRGPCDTDDELKEASKQMLGGIISPSLINLKQLRFLDLSCNDFGSSKIPAFIGSFQNLSYLNLSKSQFYGEIPHHLGNLSTLRVLDLYGDPIFSILNSKSLKWLKNLKRLQHLDMSGIDLSKASDWLHFTACGQPTGDPEENKEEDDESDSIDWILVIVTTVGLTVGFWIIIAPLLASNRWRNAYYHFLDKMRIKILDSILLKYNCFKRCEPKDQVQRFDISQYIYDQPEGFYQNKAVHEASSSTNSI